jgi:hypothetical protein
VPLSFAEYFPDDANVSSASLPHLLILACACEAPLVRISRHGIGSHVRGQEGSDCVARWSTRQLVKLRRLKLNSVSVGDKKNFPTALTLYSHMNRHSAHSIS